MPKISSKAIDMPESPIRKLVPFAEAAKSKGRTVYHLNIGQPDIASPKAALDAIKNIDLKVIEYSHSAGFESYRNKLAEYYRNNGIEVSGKDILITTGGSEALLFGLMTACNSEDEVIIPEPFYANYNGFAMSAGLNVIPVSSSIEEGFALPPISDIEKKITSDIMSLTFLNLFKNDFSSEYKVKK